MIDVICCTSPPRNPRPAAASDPTNPIEKTLLPMTRSPGVMPLRCRQNISFPDRPVMMGMGVSFRVGGDYSTRKEMQPPRRRGAEEDAERKLPFCFLGVCLSVSAPRRLHL